MEAPVGSSQEWEAIIASFLRDHLRRAGSTGLVVGLSGGLDSAVVAMLAARAIGPENVVGITMPTRDSNPQDAVHAHASADAAGIVCLDRPIDAVVDGAAQITDLTDPQIKGNAKARARMMVLYAEAQSRGWLVAGTGNKSESLIGYFTKHGDGGVDLQPIGDLYKTQVRSLAAHIGVPADIITKPPSAGLWEGQTDEEELGLSYEDLDRILKGIELNTSPAEIVAKTGLDAALVDRIGAMVRQSEHKRHPPTVPKIGIRTVGIDWRRPVHWDA